MNGIVYFLIVSSILMFGSALPAEGQTPVMSLISQYDDVDGARNFIASGGRMAFARKFIKATPVAPLASEVTSLAVLKMENVKEPCLSSFESDLKDVLKHYVYYGKQTVKYGIVDVYVLPSDKDHVSELVIYNPEIFSLNCLAGDFTVDSLLKIAVPPTQ